MAYLSPQMRAIIRQHTQAQMTQTCTIEKLADSVGSLGQHLTGLWQVTASNVPCRLITSKEATLPAVGVFADRTTMDDTYRISLPVGTVLAADYRVTVNGTVWRVAAVLDARTDAADVQAVLMRMRQE